MGILKRLDSTRLYSINTSDTAAPTVEEIAAGTDLTEFLASEVDGDGYTRITERLRGIALVDFETPNREWGWEGKTLSFSAGDEVELPAWLFEELVIERKVLPYPDEKGRYVEFDQDPDLLTLSRNLLLSGAIDRETFERMRTGIYEPAMERLYYADGTTTDVEELVALCERSKELDDIRGRWLRAKELRG